MTRYIILIISFAVVTKQAICDPRHDIRKGVEELKRRSEEMYGEVDKKVEFEIEDELLYPNGDKQKLAKISELWNNHYGCLSRLAASLTPSKQLPSDIAMVYAGAAARLRCGLCAAPGERAEVAWFYAESLQNLTFMPMEDKDRVVEESGNITIYNVALEDAGVYRCQIGDGVGGLVVLQVVDDEKYTIVKPLSYQGPHPSPAQQSKATKYQIRINESKVLSLISIWSPWSECSVCGRVGRRRRYGICYVRFEGNGKNKMESVKRNSTTVFKDTQDRQGILESIAINVFEVFPQGIPCRSEYLPRSIGSMQIVKQRHSEIMIGMCKVPCKDQIFEVRSSSGEVLERVNNSAGVYSLAQRLPPQPPLPVRDIVFAVYGGPLVLPCPGTILRDMPVTWRVGTRHVVPRNLDRGSGGRVHLNARDQLVFATVLYTDANLYSCWQEDNLAGTIKLVVWQGAQAHWNHHTALLALVLVGGVLLRVAERVLRNKQRRLGLL